MSEKGATEAETHLGSLSQLLLTPTMSPRRPSSRVPEKAALRIAAFTGRFRGPVAHGSVAKGSVRFHRPRVPHPTRKGRNLKNFARAPTRRIQFVAQSSTCVRAQTHTHPPVASITWERSLNHLPRFMGGSRLPGP